jgi:triosephosphate isomerase
MTVLKPFVCGNWKMNTSRAEALALAEGACAAAQTAGDRARVGIAPPAVWLAEVATRCAGSGVEVWAQNIGFLESGALTGEISAAMAKEAGATGTLIGHSERRNLMGLSDAQVDQACTVALAAGLDVILCVGETLDERDAARTGDVVLGQLNAGLASFPSTALARLTLAYEPVWAIGTGRTATPEQAAEVHGWIRTWLQERWGADSDGIVIQYGGSVKPSNAAELLNQPAVDGALVGGASLDVGSWAGIVEAAASRSGS